MQRLGAHVGDVAAQADKILQIRDGSLLKDA